MESGSLLAFTTETKIVSYTQTYANITYQAGCYWTWNPLQCLRDLPFEKLNAIINQTGISDGWTPQVDNDIIVRQSSDQIRDGAFVRVPMIIGANTDEGSFFTPQGMNDTKAFKPNLLCKCGCSPFCTCVFYVSISRYSLSWLFNLQHTLAIALYCVASPLLTTRTYSQRNK